MDEKQDLQRLVWQLESKEAACAALLNKSQQVVWREATARREASKLNRLMHMKLRQTSLRSTATDRGGVGYDIGGMRASGSGPV